MITMILTFAISVASLICKAAEPAKHVPIEVQHREILTNQTSMPRIWGKELAQLKVSLTLTNSTITRGRPLVCNVVVENVAPETQYVTETYPDSDFEFVLTSSSGRTISTNPDILKSAEELKRMRVILQAHAAIAYRLSFVASDLAPGPGTYKLRVNYIHKPGKRMRIPSNQVDVSVD